MIVPIHVMSAHDLYLGWWIPKITKRKKWIRSVLYLKHLRIIYKEVLGEGYKTPVLTSPHPHHWWTQGLIWIRVWRWHLIKKRQLGWELSLSRLVRPSEEKWMGGVMWFLWREREISSSVWWRIQLCPMKGLVFVLSSWEEMSKPLGHLAWQESVCLPGGLQLQ